jgi:ribosomal protein L11 methylase PrmA
MIKQKEEKRNWKNNKKKCIKIMRIAGKLWKTPIA